MDKIIFWNKKAVKKFHSLVQYLEENYSEQTAENLVRNVHLKLQVLVKYPEIGRLSAKKKTIRVVSINRFLRMFYRVHRRKIIVITFFDTRQNPEDHPFANS